LYFPEDEMLAYMKRVYGSAVVGLEDLLAGLLDKRKSESTGSSALG
jgi:hypothetical protein